MNKYKNLFKKEQEMTGTPVTDKVTFFVKYKTQILFVGGFLVALIVGDQAQLSKYANYIKYDDTEVREQIDNIDSKVDEVEIRVEKIEKELPMANKNEVIKKFPSLDGVDLSVLNGN